MIRSGSCNCYEGRGVVITCGTRSLEAHVHVRSRYAPPPCGVAYKSVGLRKSLPDFLTGDAGERVGVRAQGPSRPQGYFLFGTNIHITIFLLISPSHSYTSYGVGIYFLQTMGINYLTHCILQDTLIMVEIRQTETYRKWFDSIRDKNARVRIDIRIRRLSLGNYGDIKPVGGGISEIRIDYGPGYRVYFVRRGNQLIILLAGGNKSTQSRDIEKAREIFRDLEA
jgi:putative addiction module killer protein